MGTVSGSRSSWALLLDRNFGPYFWGNVVSNTGVWAYNVGAVVLIFQITGSAFYVGLVTIMQFTAPVVLAPVGGALADRFDRRKLMMVALACAGVAVSGLAAWGALVGQDRITNPWPVLLMSLGFGIALAVTDPARHALVAALVPTADLGQAVALNTVTFNLGRTLGPALSGLLLLSLGPIAVFVAVAASYLLFVAALAVIKPLRAEPDSGPHGAGARAGVAHRGFTAGIRYVWAHKRMLAMLVGIAAAGYGSDPVITLVPLLAHDLMAGGGPLKVDNVELAVGILAGAYGGGAVLAMLFVRRVNVRIGYRATGVLGLTTLALMIGVLGVAPELLTGSAALAVGGVGYFFAITALTTSMQLDVPEHLRGRVMALWGVFFLGSRPLAALVDSTLASVTTLTWALVGTGVVVAAAALAVARATRERSGRRVRADPRTGKRS